MIKFQFKFKDQVSEAGRENVIGVLGNYGAAEVRPLFPEATDEELASFYIVDCQNAAIGRELLNLLNGFETVEFAEEELQRKLIP